MTLPLPDLLAKLRCGDNSCVMGRSGGMGTNGGCHCEARELRQAVLAYRRETESLRTQLAAAQQDTKRIDFIENHDAQVASDISPFCWRVDVWETNFQRATLREAIDAARPVAPPPGETA